MIEKLLEIGFSDKEAKIYLELLKLGAQPASVLARRLNINRSSLYNILKKLEKKGVILAFLNKDMKYFSANDPNCLVAYLDRKSRTYDYFKSKMLSAIPDLRLLKDSSIIINDPIVRSFEGREGIKFIMNELTSIKKYFSAYISLDKWKKSPLGDFFFYKNFNILTSGEDLRAIVFFDGEDENFFETNTNWDLSKLEILYTNTLFNNDFLCQNDIYIYDGKVVILHVGENEEYGVIIESTEIASMQKNIFEVVWDKAFTRKNK